MTASPARPPTGKTSKKRAEKARRMTFGARLRTYFFAGVLVTAPIAITFFVAWTFIEFVDRKVVGNLPQAYQVDLPVPGIGLLLLVVLLTIIGAFTAGYLGRLLVRFGEGLVQRVPVVRSIHGALKQIIETILAQQSSAFRQVVLVEYPRRGMWALGFITGVTEGEVQNLTEDEVINVFLPTTPNPTSGFLLFVPRQDLVVLDMSVEDGIKMIISGGIFTPADRRPKEVRKVPLVTASPEDDPIQGSLSVKKNPVPTEV
ncbi:DUF502 domain-containing protein [Rhodospirillum rubrum]|uniref:DUF502 domain-containing protein n=1 Tax=Rhodospirillum rubrum (strain ATCC 11170 / ATH 1.1.1 / DSM 467 / LMG 4362 / NCIMB 8255 / S1) TaxID=269796 RepID=Q2RTL6_RHORT|nr:DUF502 domain-containing protein [Rhodospirillum rubrum]ABC22529.1 Protein of unknown function DUF502 [Rhodospirillum rubrum ATCC 11170]AEO48247.1 hypothetical protein F11_08905 [Rhodospirillum rubrum F11]MBK5954117.1 hypothetical protein [Rhodospirillum rubrum]QXG82157.1 DUF502 domain-containing protein [Rhodospirillum rubrum]